MIEPVTVDFETAGIVGNPILNPPRPVGVAIYVPKQEPFYLAFGHPTNNNCSWADAHEYLRRIKESGCPMLFHNAGFDLSVWNTNFCNAVVNLYEWERIHDTMYLLFLSDPYSQNLSLKPNVTKYLGKALEERDELRAWIRANVPESTAKDWGAYICRAPGDLVGGYAIRDVVDTRELFDKLHAEVVDLEMEGAYDRERRLFPITYFGTKCGIRIDRDSLEHHESVYTQCLSVAEQRIITALGASEAIFHSDEILADALENSGAVSDWVLTPTGKRSMAKDNLKISDPVVKILMEYRGALMTCLQTFMRPWLKFSELDGRVHPNWNQVRQPRDDRGVSKGTRTGRLSSDSPNFQNVPTEYTDNQGNPLIVPEGLYHVPYMRRYCLPEVGHVWLKRDFSSQEIRILAHFEDGSLCEAYKINPDLDPHAMAVNLVAELIGLTYSRKSIKITGFSIIYGSGYTGLSYQLGQPYEEAYKIKNSYLAAMPGIGALMSDVQNRGRNGQPIRTWGGRLYYVEAPKLIKGRMMDFAYKLMNYLIQGSAADHTKEALCDWQDIRKWDEVFLATVHDECNISAPEETAGDAMSRLQEAMDRDRFDVPIRSEGFMGPNWHDISAVPTP
jgi:DNA polymerase-1